MKRTVLRRRQRLCESVCVGGRAVRAHCWGRKSIDQILEEARVPGLV